MTSREVKVNFVENAESHGGGENRGSGVILESGVTKPKTPDGELAEYFITNPVIERRKQFKTTIQKFPST